MCRRKPGKLCSPSEGLCCNPDTCAFYPGGEFRPCRVIFTFKKVILAYLGRFGMSVSSIL